MLIGLIFKSFLLLFSIFLYWYVGVSMPKSASYELGPEQWPQWLLVILIICCAVGIYQEYSKLKAANYRFDVVRAKAAFIGFFKSRLLMAALVLTLYGFIMEPMGFIPSVFIFMCLMPLVFGERTWWKIGLVALCTTLVLYFGFAILLQLRLPRGTITVFRDFSLWLETVF